jgi:SAM-dependent methyltransferase
MKKIYFFICLLFKNYSLLRIFQIMECLNIKLKNKSLEFGAQLDKEKNFSYFIKGNSNFDYTNLFNNKKMKIFYVDLTKKNKIKSNKYENVLLFNVLEHLDKYESTFSEIKRILKKNGNFIGSTPFLYQIHGAPKDYFRFSKQFYEKNFQKHKYKNIQIKNLGYGPFVSCYSLLQAYLKYLPIISQILLFFCFIIDTFLQIFIKTNLKEIFPIGIFFSVKK